MSKYVIIHGQLREVSDDELMHYGVKGMKWGVRKEDYNAMTRQQRKATRERYYQTDEGRQYKTTRNTIVGTVLGGPLVGAAAGLVTAHRNGLLQKRVDRGKNHVEKLSTTKINELAGNNEKSTRTESKRVASIKNRVTGKKENGKPAFLMSEKELEDFSNSYQTRRKKMLNQYHNTSDGATKQKLQRKLDQMENDYLSVVEQDFWYSDD